MVASQVHFFKLKFNHRLHAMIAMSTMVERIQTALKAKKISWSKAATSIGLSAQAPSKWKKGQISKENLEKLADLLGVDVGWLLTGNGDIEQVPNKTENLQENLKDEVTHSEKRLKRIPLLDFVQAGLFHDVGYDGVNSIGDSWTTYESHKPECVFGLKIEGLSMAPEFMPGDELIVDASLVPRPGSLVIAQEIQHGIARTTFKKYRVIGVNEYGVDVIELVPLNPDFPTYNSTQIDISIIGVVVRHNREFKY